MINAAKHKNRFRIAGLIIRFILGGVFIYAGLHKIIDPGRFALIVFNYRLAPDQLINPTAIILPWLEFWLGALVISGLWLRASTIIINVLLLIFMAAIGFNLWRGLDFNCGCFSSSAEGGLATWLTLVRDGVLFLLGLFLLRYAAVTGPDHSRAR